MLPVVVIFPIRCDLSDFLFPEFSLIKSPRNGLGNIEFPNRFTSHGLLKISVKKIITVKYASYMYAVAKRKPEKILAFWDSIIQVSKKR